MDEKTSAPVVVVPSENLEGNFPPPPDETMGRGLSFRRKIQGFIRTLKIAKLEPAILLHMIAFKMFYLTLQNIMLETACRVNLNYSTEVCDNLTKRDTDNLTDEEVAVQKFVSDIIRWKSLIDNFFPLIFVIFLGAWSDKNHNGRKLPIVLPLIGYTVQTIGVIFCLADKSASAYSIAVVASLPVAITGSIATFNMAVFSYIADVTPLESRTFRTGITNAAFLMGMSSGNALGGLLSGTSLGFEMILGISGGLDVIALAWMLLIVRNDTRKGSELHIRKNKTMDTIKDIFNPLNVLDACKTVLKKREGTQRMQIFLLIFACYFFVTVPEYGEESVFYLFLRYQLNWDGQDYGYFSTYRLLIGFIGGLMAIGLLSYTLRLSDPLVGVICSISQFSACFVYAFAKTTTMMYIAPAVDMWNSTMSLIAKVIVAKIVPTSEIGKVYSFMGCVDAFIPLVANPLYTTVYKATFENILPGLFFLISAVMTIPPFFVFIWLFFASRAANRIRVADVPNSRSPLCSSRSSGGAGSSQKTSQD